MWTDEEKLAYAKFTRCMYNNQSSACWNTLHKTAAKLNSVKLLHYSYRNYDKSIIGNLPHISETATKYFADKVFDYALQEYIKFNKQSKSSNSEITTRVMATQTQNAIMNFALLGNEEQFKKYTNDAEIISAAASDNTMCIYLNTMINDLAWIKPHAFPGTGGILKQSYQAGIAEYIREKSLQDYNWCHPNVKNQ